MDTAINTQKQQRHAILARAECQRAPTQWQGPAARCAGQDDLEKKKKKRIKSDTFSKTTTVCRAFSKTTHRVTDKDLGSLD
jgi:hypothetical protein